MEIKRNRGLYLSGDFTYQSCEDISPHVKATVLGVRVSESVMSLLTLEFASKVVDSRSVCTFSRQSVSEHQTVDDISSHPVIYTKPILWC